MLLVAFVATTAFAACGGDDGDDNGGATVTDLNLTKTELTFSSSGGTENVSVQAPQQAQATSNQPWCTVTAGTMSANLKVTPLTVTVAAMTTETADRTAVITVSAGSQRGTITVTQKAGERIIIDQTEYDVPAEASRIEVKVTAKQQVEAKSDVSWIIFSSSTGAQVGNTYKGTFGFTVVANPTISPRTGTITFQYGEISATVTVSQAAGQQTTITADAKTIARQMYPAWNLGNTMEGGNNANNFTNKGGLGAETSWQSTKTTQQIIDFVKSQGFKSVRIPTAWVMGHVNNDTDVTIDAAWMARVKEVVDYCIGSGLYVVLNDHWDGGWLENSFGDTSAATVAKKSEQLRKLWTQIAEAFRDYDEHLLFAGLNEPGMNGANFTAAITTVLIGYEQVFIDAVRATGGNNSQRILVVQGPFTDIDQTCKASNNYDMSRFNDPAGSGRLMVEVHYYTPWQFCGMDKDESWGKMKYYWGTGNGQGDRFYSNGESEMKNLFKKMYTSFASKGYPVILGECGANYRFANDAQHDASIKAWYKSVTTEAVSNGCIPFYWDTNYTGFPNMTIINRAKLQVNNQHMMDGINEGLAAATWPL